MPIRQAIQGFFKGFRGGYSSGAASRRAKEELEKKIAKSAIPPVALNRAKESFGAGYLLLLLILGGVGYVLWDVAVGYGYIPHDRLTIVTAKNWTIGEYKSCTSQNIVETKDEPQIDCTSLLGGGEPKKFEVRFYGATFREELGNVSFTWRCQKNDGTNLHL